MLLLKSPIMEYVPDYYKSELQEQRDNEAVTLYNIFLYLQNMMNDIHFEIIEETYLSQVSKVPVDYIPQKAYNYAVENELFDIDTIEQKRRKIRNAIRSYKLRGLWQEDIKIIIDNITGKDTEIIDRKSFNMPIYISDNIFEPLFESFPMSYVADQDDADSGYGIRYIVSSEDYGMPGVILIDLKFTFEEIYQETTAVNIAGNETYDTKRYSTIGIDGINDWGLYINGNGLYDYIETMQEYLKSIELSIKTHVPIYFVVFCGFINENEKFIPLLRIN